MVIIYFFFLPFFCAGSSFLIPSPFTYVGTTSFEVRVDAYKEDLQGMRYPINRAYLTMVAIDTDGTPRTVPPIEIETESERAEWEAAKKRREYRLHRNREGF